MGSTWPGFPIWAGILTLVLLAVCPELSVKTSPGSQPLVQRQSSLPATMATVSHPRGRRQWPGFSRSWGCPTHAGGRHQAARVEGWVTLQVHRGQCLGLLRGHEPRYSPREPYCGTMTRNLPDKGSCTKGFSVHTSRGCLETWMLVGSWVHSRAGPWCRLTAHCGSWTSAF